VPKTGSPIEAEAIAYIKAHKRELVEEHLISKGYQSVEYPISYFMAGSPGAGKTEFSKVYVDGLNDRLTDSPVYRLDPDEIRSFFPQYTGVNSEEIQAAVSIATSELFSYCQEKRLHVLVDGTFSRKVSMENVKRALGRNRRVFVMYIYQDPLIAWDFTQKREVLEGRNIPKQAFIEAYFQSYENMVLLKELHADKVTLTIVVKDGHNQPKETLFDVTDVRAMLKIPYPPQQLEEIL
jgi:predicted ABC-type ATPase